MGLDQQGDGLSLSSAQYKQVCIVAVTLDNNGTQCALFFPPAVTVFPACGHESWPAWPAVTSFSRIP
jgi:hypothetical protein